MANDDVEYESEGGMMDRIKESPRTVSALIIILIVAAAIYAFSGDPTPNTPENEQIAATDETPAPSSEEELAETPAPNETSAVPAATPTQISQEELSNQSKSLPEATKTDSGYTEVAQAGDGYTHLARRAATRWLAENQAGYTVTNEHRVFIEDYIQNRLGSAGLSLGHSHTISFDVISEAVTQAGTLTDSQLRNLTRYTTAL